MAKLYSYMLSQQIKFCTVTTVLWKVNILLPSIKPLQI